MSPIRFVYYLFCPSISGIFIGHIHSDGKPCFSRNVNSDCSLLRREHGFNTKEVHPFFCEGVYYPLMCVSDGIIRNTEINTAAIGFDCAGRGSN